MTPSNSSTSATSSGDPVSAAIMIFGASGDLTSRKLIPALYHLWTDGYLSDDAPIIGVARRTKTDEEFRSEMYEAVCKTARTGCMAEEMWQQFAKRLFYHETDITSEADFQSLKKRVEELESGADTDGKRVAYLAISPSLFLPAVQNLSAVGMCSEDQGKTLRVVVEKPFGHDLKSAQELSVGLKGLLDESQIFRIDHYLGKETVQNILLFRFGNPIFESLMSRSHVDHVQISVAETFGMESGRGGYYDKAGATRDVLQNHVLQLLCLTAMEPPAYFRGANIRDEKLKVLQALRGAGNHVRDWAIPGQYTEGEINGESVPSYRNEDRIPEGSNRETYVAMKVEIDNWRWAGVPFYLRHGKRMPKRVTEVAVQFKQPPLRLFETVECDGNICEIVENQPNQLIFRIQPKESIALKFSTKRPGMQYQIQPVTMDFEYEDEFEGTLPEAYERLLLDVIKGDETLFTRDDELEEAWKFIDPVLDYWEGENITPEFYSAGTAGPDAAEKLLSDDGRSWRVQNDDE